MDVKYIPSDWQRMKDGIGDLIGLGRWGKGMIDELKDLSDNLEDAESDIAKYDSDGVISFRHTSLKSKYQALYEDFQVLHRFSGKVGDIVERTIDQPFYEDMDAFVAAMQEASISNYTTKNRIGATETQYVYGGYGPAQALTVPKTEVSLDDIFSGDNFYGKQMQLEYEAWKEMNPDQDYTREEYQMGVVNTRAFEYESIRSQQESKEFWVQLGALVVIVGTTLLCPPAGIALGVAYGAMELGSAVSGKDWVSGRELGTGERWFRGLLAPLDIIPGVGAIAKFGSAARLVRVGDQVGQLGLTTGIRSGFKQGVAQVDNLIQTASRETIARLKSANAAVKDAANVVKNKLAKDIIEVGDLIDSGITKARNAFQLPQTRLVMANVGDIGRVSAPIENSHTVGNKMRDMLSRIDGVNLEGAPRGTGDIGKGNSDLIDNTGRFKDDELQLKYDEYCERKYKAGETPKGPLEWKDASEKWASLREQGQVFSDESFTLFSQQYENAQREITIVTHEGTKVRVDAIASDELGNVLIQEYKSSASAPYTPNQEKGFPELKNSGGAVVGEGKGDFTEGYGIPSGTRVQIVRPEGTTYFDE